MSSPCPSCHKLVVADDASRAALGDQVSLLLRTLHSVLFQRSLNSPACHSENLFGPVDLSLLHTMFSSVSLELHFISQTPSVAPFCSRGFLSWNAKPL